MTFLSAVTKVNAPPHTPESVFISVTFCLWGCSLEIKLLLVQRVTKQGRFTPHWGSARSEKEAARQRNLCSLLMQGVLALSRTESVVDLKHNLPWGEELRGKKKQMSRKSFVYHSRPCSPSSSSSSCVMMRGVCGELGVQPVDGSDQTHDSPGPHTPTLPSSWAGC